MADLLNRELGVEVELVEGNKNEFSVWVDDKVVAKAGWFTFLTDKKIVSAVRRQLEA